jgi:hypothetical protein
MTYYCHVGAALVAALPAVADKRDGTVWRQPAAPIQMDNVQADAGRHSFRIAQKLNAAGLERLLVNYHVSRKPAGLVPKPGRPATYEAIDSEYADSLHRLGFPAGRYDYYRTIFPPSRQQGQWIMRRTGYCEQCTADEKGNIRAGFMGKVGAKDILGHRCSWRQYEMTQAYVTADVDRVGYDARLIDTTAAVGWQECYSQFHPATRAEDAQYRIKQLAFVKDYGQITGTEHVADRAVPVTHYAEAPATFVRFFTNPLSQRERLIPAPIPAPAEYRQVVLNENLRLPLWQLVYHDAIVTTSRWDWTPKWRVRTAPTKSGCFDCADKELNHAPSLSTASNIACRCFQPGASSSPSGRHCGAAGRRVCARGRKAAAAGPLPARPARGPLAGDRLGSRRGLGGRQQGGEFRLPIRGARLCRRQHRLPAERRGDLSRSD